DAIARKDMRSKIKVIAEQLSSNLPSIAQALDQRRRHVQVQSTLVGSEADVNDAITVAGSRGLNIVSPVLHGVHDRPKKPQQALQMRSLVKLVRCELRS